MMKLSIYENIRLNKEMKITQKFTKKDAKQHVA